MQEKKLLRDALQAIIDYIESHKIDVMDSYGDLLHVAGMADKALASTTEETEMEKLVAWLKTSPPYAVEYETVGKVLHHIRTEFGYGEEEGDADSAGD